VQVDPVAKILYVSKESYLDTLLPACTSQLLCNLVTVIQIHESTLKCRRHGRFCSCL